MILGTVELGLDYGVNNNSGKTTKKQALELLDIAWNNGIRELDTAAAYGDAEEIIGYSEHNFLIDTKLPVSISGERCADCLSEACMKLKTNSLNILYLHSFEQVNNAEIVEFLREQKDKGIIKQIGISIYEPSEMQYITKQLHYVDVIQFPFNVFDNCRWVEQIQQAKEAQKKLYARSIFLQGLIFKDRHDNFIRSIGAIDYIESLQKICKEADTSIAELACHYVLQEPHIDEIIIGCQTTNDVLVNTNILNSKKNLDTELMQRISELSKTIPINVVDPRRWKR